MIKHVEFKQTFNRNKRRVIKFQLKKRDVIDLQSKKRDVVKNMLNLLKVVYTFNVFQLSRSQDAFQQFKTEDQQLKNVKQQQSLTVDVLSCDSKNFK